MGSERHRTLPSCSGSIPGLSANSAPPRPKEHSMNTRELNLQKKELTCLGCGKTFKHLTRSRRFCKKCMRRNKKIREYSMRGAVRA